MGLEHISSEQFDRYIKENEETAIVVFTKETCQVCKKLLPYMKQIAADYDNDDTIHFYQMDVLEPESRLIFKSMKLVGVPQSVFFKDGVFYDALPGAVEEKILRKAIKDMLNPKQSFTDKIKNFFGK